MARVIYALLGASVTLAAAWALGAILLRKLVSSLHRLEQWLLGIIVGSACLSAIVFALCSVGIARKAVYLSIALLAGILAFRWGVRGVSADRPQPLHGVLRTLFVLAFGALTVLHLFSALSPEIYPGDTTQHLSQVDRAHGFHAGSTVLEGSRLLLLPAFAFGRHVGAEFVTVGILAALSLLVFCYGWRVGYPVAGVAAALLTYAAPAICRHFSVANIDVIGAAAVFALFYLLRLWDRQHALPLSVSIGLLAGFCLIANRTAVAAPNLSALLPEQYRWVSLALLPLCLAPLFLALALAAGRPLLGAASILAITYFATGATQAFVFVSPFIVLAWCMGWWNLALVGTWSSSAARAAQPVTSYAIPTSWLRLAGAVILFSYFAYFAWDGLFARFSIDDPANIFGYWQRGGWPLIRAQFEFFSTYYRPMGGMFYLPIYDLAGFNPLPYRVVALLIVLLNIAVFYRVAKLVSGSERVAWVAAILIAYHPKLADIVYQNAVIYDVLCFLFYFAALAWYVGIRARGQLCNWRQTAVFVVLYICALNSKEMAVTLPVTLGLYELMFHPPLGVSRQTIGAWLAREGRVCFMAAALTAVYILGKTLGPDPLVAIPAYTPEFTLQRFMASIGSNIRTLFYLPGWFGQGMVAGACVALLVFAWIRKSRYVAFCVLFAILSELPIAFLDRSGSSLYIPLGAWAMLVSAAVWKAAELVASVFRTRAIAGLLVATLLCFNARLAWSESAWVRSYFQELHAPVWSAIQQFSKFEIQPPHQAKLAFMNDPLPPFTTLYLAYFHFQDLSLHIRLSKTALPEAELSDVDYVFDYRDGKFVLVKP